MNTIYWGNRTASIDQFRNVTSYTYDALNRLIKTTYPSILLEDNSTVSPVSKTCFDINHHPITIRQPGGWETTFTYNSRGKPLTKTYPDGRVEKFEYYLDGTLAKSIAPNGSSTTYKRDFLGRVLEEAIYDGKEEVKTTYTYKGSHLIAKTDGEGLLTQYTYDDAGRLSSEKAGDFFKTYSYDSLGRIDKIAQWYGEIPQEVIVQAYVYNFLNQVTEERLEEPPAKNGSVKVLQKTRYTYDELGNKTHIYHLTDAGEMLTRTEFNGFSQPVWTVDAQKNEFHYAYHYDIKNNLGQFVLQVEITDPKGRITKQTHDALGRVREVTCKEPFTQRILSKQEQFYDPLGRATKTIDQAIIDGTSKRNYVIKRRYYYNEDEEFIEEKGGGLSKQTQWVYNPIGQREVMIKPDGEKLTHKYDCLGRLEEIFSSDKTIHYVYEYDRCNRVKKVEDKLNQTMTVRNYDSLGSIIEETLANGLTFKYDYDRLSRLKKFTLPDNSQVHYHYHSAYLNEISRVKDGHTLYSHQNNQHNLSGAVIQSTLIGKAGSLFKTYDNLGRIQEIESPHWKQQIPSSGYDQTGCLLTSKTHDPIGLISQSFSYNDLDHLKTEDGYQTHSYATDSLQNRLQKNEKLCEVNGLNQLIQQGSAKFSYDKNGNIIKKEEHEEITAYRYDAFDRLISIAAPKGTTTYQYDPFHRRLSKTHQGSTTRYLYQGQNEIGSMNDRGEITELRILSANADSEQGSSIALELYGKTYAPIHDRQGHIVCLIDAETGQPVETYRYSAFGEETIFNAQGQKATNSSVGNPWRFSSKRVDPETGWIFFGRRYYDPEIGRWTTSDPLGFTDGPNLYAYLHHNPLMGFDAYGLLGEAFRDFCKPEFSRNYFTNESNNDSSYSYRPERAELDVYSGWNNFVQAGSQAYGNGFAHGASNPFKTGFDNSGIGLFINYTTNTGQSDFKENTQRSGVIHFCDKAGELCGAWAVLYSSARVALIAVEYGWGYTGFSYARQRGAQYVVENVASSPRSSVVADEVVGSARQVFNDNVGFNGSQAIAQATKGSRNRLAPNSNAVGAHSVFRRDPSTGVVTHYETFVPQTNAFDPKPWQSAIRYDGFGKAHLNKVLNEWIKTPHVHDPFYPGEIRYAVPREVPK